MLDTIALPDSTKIDGQARTITHRWYRDDVEVTDREGGRRAVELTVMHDGNRKQYTASLHIIDVHPGYITAHISPYHGIRLHAEPCARYSAKALEGVNAFIMGTLPTLVATEDRVATLFSGHPLPGAR
jgi:hypothetical protein